MRWFDCLAILFSGGKFYLMLFLCKTIKINSCCVISLAQYIYSGISRSLVLNGMADLDMSEQKNTAWTETIHECP